jgi:hypothetical protein
MLFRILSVIIAFSEPALEADFPLLSNEILLPNLVFFRSLLGSKINWFPGLPALDFCRKKPHTQLESGARLTRALG